jgi:hypothetical protein
VAVTSPPATRAVTLTIDGGGAEARPQPRSERDPEEEPESAPPAQRPSEPA